MGGRKRDASEPSEGPLRLLHNEIAIMQKLCKNYAKGCAKSCTFFKATSLDQAYFVDGMVWDHYQLPVLPGYSATTCCLPAGCYAGC